MPKVHTKRWLVPRSRLVGKRIYDGYGTPIKCIVGIIFGYMVTFYRASWWVVEQLICVYDDTAALLQREGENCWESCTRRRIESTRKGQCKSVKRGQD